MDGESTQQNDSQAPVNPWPVWGKPESNFDLSQIKPHQCMTDLVQRGNYLHCNTGNHGMRIPVGKMLTKDEQGNFDLIDQPLSDSKGKVVAKNITDVVVSS